MSAKRKIILIFIASCTLLAVYETINTSSMPEIPFESNEWKAAAGDRSSTLRLTMLEDLLSRHQLASKSRAEVINLLGNPEQENYFSEYEMMYRLGNDGGLLAGPKYMAIRFTPGDTIDELAILKD